MSDKLYDVLYESWQQMANPTLITEAEVRATFPSYSDRQVADVKAICEGYLKLEEILLGSSTEVLLERFAGDDQAMVPSNEPFDPEKTLGKPPVPAAPKAAAKKPGMWDKMKGAVKGGGAALAKGKEFVKKVKELYTKYNGNKILIVLAAGLVISTVVPLLPGGAAIAAAAKVAFGGFNIFKGGKSFWQEFKKEKKDRNTVKIVLAVLQTGLGIFSSIVGGSQLMDQIAALKQQVIAAAGEGAAHAGAAAPHPTAPTPDAPAAPPHVDPGGLAGTAADMSKYTNYGAEHADQIQAAIQDAAMNNQSPAGLITGFGEKVGEIVKSGKFSPEQGKAILQGFADHIAHSNGGLSASKILGACLKAAHIQ